MGVIRFILLRKKFRYREILGELVSGILFIVIQFSFFKSFVAERNDYNSSSFFIYIIFSFIISSCCSVPIVETFCSGYQRNTLYKKYIFCRSYFFSLVTYYFLEKLIVLIFFSSIFIIISFCVGLIDFSFFKYLPYFLAAVFSSFLLDIFLRITLGSILIANRNYNSLIKAYNQVARILSGAIVPLSFFPIFLKNIIFYLPFYFLVFFPLEVLINGNDIKKFYIQTSLTIFFFFIAFFSFTVMTKKLKQEGGI